MGKEAVLIIDMLNDFVLDRAPLQVPATKHIIPDIKEEIKKARASKIPVIYICDSHEPDDNEFSRFGWPPHAVKGTEGAKVIEELIPTKDDIIIEKKTYSGFYNTELDKKLKELGITTLLLTGCVTNICILFTASDAVLRGYNVKVFENCVAGLNKEDHDFALRLMSEVLGIKVL
ncbi:MAG: isochorismatase family cysteine hydrolase [Nitrospirota bacterium]